MDVLTQVIRSANIRSVIYGRLELSAPWGVRMEVHRHLLFYAVAQGAKSVAEPHEESGHVSASSGSGRWASRRPRCAAASAAARVPPR